MNSRFTVFLAGAAALLCASMHLHAQEVPTDVNVTLDRGATVDLSAGRVVFSGGFTCQGLDTLRICLNARQRQGHEMINTASCTDTMTPRQFVCDGTTVNRWRLSLEPGGRTPAEDTEQFTPGTALVGVSAVGCEDNLQDCSTDVTIGKVLLRDARQITSIPATRP
ncbi:MAG: hypothetical protein AB2A00_40495 [Myxococcota bacterium]